MLFRSAYSIVADRSPFKTVISSAAESNTGTFVVSNCISVVAANTSSEPALTSPPLIKCASAKGCNASVPFVHSPGVYCRPSGISDTVNGSDVSDGTAAALPSMLLCGVPLLVSRSFGDS